MKHKSYALHAFHLVLNHLVLVYFYVEKVHNIILIADHGF